MPEALICGGREHAYISNFIYSQTFIRGAITSEDIDEYVRAYSHPGAFRAAMEMYRQFPQDAADNRAAGQLPPDLKVLAVGAETRWGPALGRRIQTTSPKARGEVLARSGHFLAEEQPEAFLDMLLGFLKEVDASASHVENLR